MEKKFKAVEYINKNTGEVFSSDDIIVKYDTVEDNKKKYFKRINKDNDFINNNLGYYFHLLYKDLLELDLEPQMMIRFLILCSHLDYNNNLVLGETKGRRTATINDLEDILKLKKREIINTKKYLIENNLIYIEDDIIKINDKYSIRGKVKGDLKNMNMTRVFNDGIQDLYNGVKPTQHKKLANFIKILPYININFNVISLEVMSDNFNECNPLTSKEVAELCGYEKPSRFIKDLLSLKVDDMFAIVKITRGDRDFLVVNPRIYYKGNNIDNLKYIMRFFDYRD